MIKSFTAAALIFLACCPEVAESHPGGLNSSGCHNNNKTGDYHCHGATPAQPAPQGDLKSLIPQKVKVVGVVDGDTIKVLLDGSEHSIRLHGIDAPESGQEYGQRATTAMKALTTGREGVRVYLDHMGHGVRRDLKAHVDNIF